MSTSEQNIENGNVENTENVVKKTRTTKPRAPKKQVATPEKVEDVETVDGTVEGTEDGKEGKEGKGGKNAAKRTFTVLSVSREGKEEEFKGGRYQSKTPAGAARKAATQACKILYGKEPQVAIDIHIKEVTKNHPSSKDYGYHAIRTKDTKDVPFAATAGKISIPFEFSMTLKSLKKEKTPSVEAEKVTSA